ncbi:hypothetical protein GJ496_005064 [Pomphorhynchus laevis]|nr:hypothetical protein GJ496_005064 [Pomphorhynchus laevis]
MSNKFLLVLVVMLCFQIAFFNVINAERETNYTNLKTTDIGGTTETRNGSTEISKDWDMSDIEPPSIIDVPLV